MTHHELRELKLKLYKELRNAWIKYGDLSAEDNYATFDNESYEDFIEGTIDQAVEETAITLWV